MLELQPNLRIFEFLSSEKKIFILELNRENMVCSNAPTNNYNDTEVSQTSAKMVER